MDRDQTDVGWRVSGLHPRLVEPHGLCHELSVLGDHFPEDRCICKGDLHKIVIDEASKLAVVPLELLAHHSAQTTIYDRFIP